MTVWPLRPNWRDTYDVTYTFKTEILTTRSGREQRRALRPNPRKSIEFLCTAGDDRFRSLGRLLDASQGKLIDLPEITRSTWSTAVSALNSKVFTLETVPAWLVTGAPVILMVGDLVERRTVASVAGSNVTFVEANATAWPASTRVCAALTTRIAGKQSLHQIVKGVADGRLTFEVEPGSEPEADGGGAPVTWNGREVFLETFNWARGQDYGFTRSTSSIDYDRGVRVVFEPVDFTTRLRAGDFLSMSAAETERLVNFFIRMRGRQGEFYAPSDDPDLVLAANASLGAPSFAVKGADVAAAYADSTVFKALTIRMTSGARHYVLIDTLQASGANTIVTLLGTLPAALTTSTVAAISWLTVNRLASDELTIEWITDQHARARLTWQTLESLAAE